MKANFWAERLSCAFPLRRRQACHPRRRDRQDAPGLIFEKTERRGRGFYFEE